MLSTESFWIAWLLEIRLYFNWFFRGTAHSRLFLSIAFGRRLFFSLSVVLPKLGEAILKVVLVINLTIILAVFRDWLRLALAGGRVDGELLVGYRLFTECAWGCSRFALFKMSTEVLGRHIEVAVFTMFWLHETNLRVLFNLTFL